MDLQERNESIGGNGSAYAYGGGIGLFLLAIFLIILFAAFRNHHGIGDAANFANTMGEFHPRENCADKLTWARFANYEDPKLAALEKQLAIDTGAIKSAIDLQTGEVRLSQERTTNAIIYNQNQIAREQEVRYFTDKLNESRDRNLELQNKLVAMEAAREADRRQAELLSQFCAMNNRVTQIEGSMLKGAPCYVPTSPVATFQCGPYTGCNGNRA